MAGTNVCFSCCLFKILEAFWPSADVEFIRKAGGSGLNPNVRLPDLPPPPPNIRLGWKLLTLANTLAYVDMAKIAAVKSFIVQTPGVMSVSYSAWQYIQRV